VAGAALVAMTLAAYLGVRHAGFIWDDEMHVTQNPAIVGPLGLKAIWTTPAARYFPLTLTTFWVEHALWGLNPLFYHALNVLMHAACAVALWRVLLGLRVRGAWLGAALWALHPVQAETVAWITELKNTQSCLFYLLAVYFFVRALGAPEGDAPARRKGDYALALLSAAMAMASKSSTVILPLVLGLCAWWLNRRWSWRVVAMLLPVLLLSAASSALTVWTQRLEGASDPEWIRSISERVATAGYDVWFYLGKLVWPSPLIFIYPRWHVAAGQVASFLPAAAVGAVFVALGWHRDGRLRPCFFAFCYFLVALIPVLGLVDQFFWRYSFVGDHFQYLASIGPLALAGAVLTPSPGMRDRGWGRLAPFVSAVLLLALGVLTARECPKYVSSEALWRSTLAANPAAWMAHNNLGAELLGEGRLDEAVGHFQASLAIQPGNVSALNNLGDGLFQLGRTDEALARYTEALRREPGNVAAQTNLGAALLRIGRIEEAIDHIRRALAVDPASGRALATLGTAYLQAGRNDEAVVEFNRALAVYPRDYSTITNLATAYVKLGRLEPAREAFERALAINPGFATALINLGNVQMQEGHVNEAIAQYQRALRAEPRSAVTHNNLALALMQAHRLDEAIDHWRTALEIDPGYAQARENLGIAIAERARAGEGVPPFPSAPSR
jgi:tetratricopeptide (TPR) repeat protein